MSTQHEDRITSYCPQCHKSRLVERVAIDPVEAVRLESTCFECTDLGHAEVEYFDEENDLITLGLDGFTVQARDE